MAHRFDKTPIIRAAILIGLVFWLLLLAGILPSIDANQMSSQNKPNPIFLSYLILSTLLSLMGGVLNFNPNQSKKHLHLPYVFHVFCCTVAISSLLAASTFTDKFNLIIMPSTAIAASMIAFFNIKNMFASIRYSGRLNQAVALMPSLLILLSLAYQYAMPRQTQPLPSSFYFAYARFLPIALFPVGLALCILLFPAMRWDQNSLKQSIYTLLAGGSIREKTFFYLLPSLHIVPLAFLLRAQFLNTEGTLQGPHMEHLFIAWIPGLYYILANIKAKSHLEHINQVIVNLTSIKARRFFLQQPHRPSNGWAATIGLKTASFVMDHDPNDESTKRLTSTLSHIRKEEINKHARSLLGQKSLYLKPLGTQLLGTIDPEESQRPCVDTLILFACVYLDVIPLVERRLRGLAGLFPIIDPDLAKRIGPHSIEESHSKMEWLYQLEYSWIDQQLVLANNSSSYGISIERFNTRQRNQIMEKLQQRNRIGNFIWLGRQAKERLMLEAPYLTGIIENWPLDLEFLSTSVYLIKFEELIPRLQKYYCLESSREILRDFELSTDAKRVLKMFHFQLTNAKNFEQLRNTIRAVYTYEWRGYKEKDRALDLLLGAYNVILSMDASRAKTLPAEEEWRGLLLYAIEKVGYPSKILHMAHMKKREIRSWTTTLSLAAKPSDPRFNEAWLFLCSAETSFSAKEDLLRGLQFIRTALKEPKIIHQAIVQSKIAEAFFNIAKGLKGSENYDLLQSTLQELALFLSNHKRPPDEISFLLDGKIFLEKWMQTRFFFDDLTKESLGKYLTALKNQDHSDQAATALSRWKILVQAEDYSEESA